MACVLLIDIDVASAQELILGKQWEVIRIIFHFTQSLTELTSDDNISQPSEAASLARKLSSEESSAHSFTTPQKNGRMCCFRSFVYLKFIPVLKRLIMCNQVTSSRNKTSIKLKYVMYIYVIGCVVCCLKVSANGKDSLRCSGMFEQDCTNLVLKNDIIK